jgi:hypothetical protein
MSKAYIETTVLTNLLLKYGSKKQKDAENALKKYDSSILPVYSIKEWKAGPLRTFAWLHDKLAVTRSIGQTLIAINEVSPYRTYLKSTSLEALDAAARLELRRPGSPDDESDSDHDRELADRYRLALASIIMRSWARRRHVATSTVGDLGCYTEVKPRIDNRTGLMDIEPADCDADPECSLASLLRANPKALIKLRNAIPETSERGEDKKRRKALKHLINTPKLPLDREMCRHLGDAVFAFFCPNDSVVLTTNLKDHKPLANALGKEAEKP